MHFIKNNKGYDKIQFLVLAAVDRKGRNWTGKLKKSIPTSFLHFFTSEDRAVICDYLNTRKTNQSAFS